MTPSTPSSPHGTKTKCLLEDCLPGPLRLPFGDTGSTFQRDTSLAQRGQLPESSGESSEAKERDHFPRGTFQAAVSLKCRRWG